MCEGPNELAIINILLQNNKLIFTSDDLLNLVPYHARQIATSSVVKTALNLYPGQVTVLRIGDKLSDTLKIPKAYIDQITDVKKYCTKPELEMLLIITENLQKKFEKVKAKTTPKSFCKNNICYNRQKYDNSTKFYYNYYENRVDLLISAIKCYKKLKGKHEKDELYLADLLK